MIPPFKFFSGGLDINHVWLYQTVLFFLRLITLVAQKRVSVLFFKK
jgi:hypothetical protein